MKAYKAKMKKINAYKPKNWKIDSATALLWDLGKTDRFWQLVGGGHGEGRHKKKCYLTWTTPMEGHLARSKS